MLQSIAEASRTHQQALRKQGASISGHLEVMTRARGSTQAPLQHYASAGITTQALGNRRASIRQASHNHPGSRLSMYLLGRAWPGICEGSPRHSVLHVFGLPLCAAVRLTQRGSLGLCLTGHLSGKVAANTFPRRLACADAWTRFPLFCQWVCTGRCGYCRRRGCFEEWLGKDSPESDSVSPSPVAVRSCD